MAAAGTDGATALRDLADAAVFAASDDEEAGAEEGAAANQTPAARIWPPPPTPATAAAAAAPAAVAAATVAAPAAARTPVYGASAELAAIATEADPTLGPLIVQALATSRRQPSMSRAFMKNVEAEDVATKTMEAIGPSLGEHDRARFRWLAGLLFAELAVVDPSLEPGVGPYSAASLTAALRELLELCSAPYRPATPSMAAALGTPAAAPTAMVPYDPAAAAAAMGMALATALGPSLAAAVSGLPPPPKPAEKKGEKLTAGQMFAYLDAFNSRPGAETKVAPHQVANRTVAAHVRESVVTYGLWPQDSAAGVEKMSPFGTLAGAFNGSDVSALELNLSNGKFEDVSRDPKASGRREHEGVPDEAASPRDDDRGLPVRGEVRQGAAPHRGPRDRGLLLGPAVQRVPHVRGHHERAAALVGEEGGRADADRHRRGGECAQRGARELHPRPEGRLGEAKVARRDGLVWRRRIQRRRAGGDAARS